MKKKQSRLIFIDNLRIYLTVLVILHHLSITYGAAGLWYYIEGRPDTITSIVISIFTAINQSYFMGFFFLIAGYFVSDSYNRKEPSRFLKDRLLRLGIPLLFYTIIIDPLICYAVAVKMKGFDQSFAEFIILYMEYRGGPGVGPLWFVLALLIFTIIYIIWRRFVPPQKKYSQPERKLPGNTKIVFFALALGIITFIVRIWFPIGWWFEPLNLEFAHLPQYASLFIIGIIAYKHNWFQQIPMTMTKYNDFIFIYTGVGF